MNKQKQDILDMAVHILKEIKLSEIETIQVNSTKYDDGSQGLTIDITYPEQKFKNYSGHVQPCVYFTDK